MDKAAFAASYSQPIGTGSLYGPPPYLYRGVEDCFIVYEAERDGVEALLPPGVEIADETPTCIAWARWVPFSTFGQYHEAYIMIRAKVDGETYLYQPFIFVDNEVPLGAGREIWGYAKKMAVFERNWGGGDTPYGEQMVFTVQRPKGNPIMTATIVCDRIADPAAGPPRRPRHPPHLPGRFTQTLGRPRLPLDAHRLLDRPLAPPAPDQSRRGLLRRLRLRPPPRQGHPQLPGGRRDLGLAVSKEHTYKKTRMCVWGLFSTTHFKYTGEPV
jgi:acetoacetate decarboxylase